MNSKYLILAAVLLLLASCDKQALPDGGTGLPMQLDASLAGDTKGSLTTADLTDFYLQVSAADPAFSYFEHASKDGSGAWTTPSRLFWKDEDTPVSYAAARFGAHAFTAAEFDDGVDLELPKDQSTQERLNAADLLTMPASSKTYEDTTDGTLPVTLAHALSTVTFTLTLGPDFYDNFFTRTVNPVKDFAVSGTNLGFNFKPKTGVVSVAADTKADIAPHPGAFTPGTSESKSATAAYEAILVPQTLAAGALKVTFHVGAYDYEWSNADAVTLAAGKTYDLAVSASTSPVCQINGHQFVDMGGGRKWAACNVGAENPWDRGDYFAWGEIAKKDTYGFTTYAHGSSSSSFTKYCTDPARSATGSPDNLTELQLSDDAARQNWGGSWRTPTEADWTWLRENCTWAWQDDYDGTGVKGMLITSDINGNTIFLPATGYYYQDKLNFKDYGYYWSSTLWISPFGIECAFSVCFQSNYGYVPTHKASDRYCGLPVRPVAN